MIMLVGVFVVAQTSTTPVVSHKLSQITKENGVALDITNTNGGNVGIGTVSPSQKLDVAGNVNAQGVCIKGDCKTGWAQVSTSGWELLKCGVSGALSCSGPVQGQYTLKCPSGKKAIWGSCGCPLYVNTVGGASTVIGTGTGSPLSDGSGWLCDACNILSVICVTST